MPIYKDKRTGRWRFDFDRRIRGGRVRRRVLLPAGWTRAQADAYDRQESAALYAIAAGIAKPRHDIDTAVSRYVRERLPGLKAAANTERELESTRDWWTGRPIEQLPTVCAEYAADQHGALAPATIANRIAYLRAACRWAWRVHGMADTDPGARVVQPSVRNARDVTISRAQMVDLARACRHRGVRAVIRIAYWTGMRVGEILAARRAAGAFVLADTKNGSPRIVPALPIISTAMRVPMPRRSEIDYYWPLARTACSSITSGCTTCVTARRRRWWTQASTWRLSARCWGTRATPAPCATRTTARGGWRTHWRLSGGGRDGRKVPHSRPRTARHDAGLNR